MDRWPDLRGVVAVNEEQLRRELERRFGLDADWRRYQRRRRLIRRLLYWSMLVLAAALGAGVAILAMALQDRSRR